MKLLLDTHVLLWWLDKPETLSKESHAAIQNSKNIVFVSTASIWEMVIKSSLGKLDLPNNLEEVLEMNQFFQLPIYLPHALAIRKLPIYHRDPFDRMLIGQAMHENLTLVARDRTLLKYPVSHIAA